MNKPSALVVMAAGMGSRFGGLKQLEPIGPNGEAILDFSVYDALDAGFNKIVFVIKHEIEKDFREIVGRRIEKKAEVQYVFQETDKLPEGFVCPADRVKPWGTGHAILCCKDAVNTPFAVVNADDYYGKSAFSHLHNSLMTNPEDYAMVGFRLANTLTENGSVSRGVCTIENGFLKDVTERTKIVDCRFTEDDVNWTELPRDTVVSMNMWGFTPDMFGYLENAFTEFLKEKIEVPKSEFYLPFVVDSLIKTGEKRVRVIPTEDKWYGVTYREDKAAVVSALKEMIDKGLYEGM